MNDRGTFSGAGHHNLLLYVSRFPAFSIFTLLSVHSLLAASPRTVVLRAEMIHVARALQHIVARASSQAALDAASVLVHVSEVDVRWNVKIDYRRWKR